MVTDSRGLFTKNRAPSFTHLVTISIAVIVDIIVSKIKHTSLTIPKKRVIMESTEGYMGIYELESI